MIIVNCPANTTTDSAPITFTVNKSTIPDTAVVRTVEVFSGGITSVGPGVIYTHQAEIKQQDMDDFATRPWQMLIPANKHAEFSDTDLKAANGGNPVKVKGNWQVRYVGENMSPLGTSTKAHTSVYLIITY